MRYIVLIISVLIFHFPALLLAQDVENTKQDSAIHVLNVPDSIDIASIVKEIDTSAIRLKPVFKPNPTKAVIYSAIFPGLGQIYNRKYWKLPLVYGGFLGCTYAITWNSNQYNGYMNAYNDWTDEDPNTNSWMDYRPYNERRTDPNTWSDQAKTNFTNRLKNSKDYYRRYRDLSIIITVGVYALTMIDAYVDAQLFDFDISPDLSMHVEPVLFEKSKTSSRSVGLQCSFNF